MNPARPQTPPLLFLFVKYSFRDKIHRVEWLHALPFLLFIAVFPGYYWAAPASFDLRYGFIVFDGEVSELLAVYGRYFAITAGTYTVLSFLLIRRKKKLIEDCFSNQSRMVYRWLELWLPAALIFFLITWVVVELTISAGRIDYSLTFGIISLFMTCYIFFVGFMGVRFARLFQQPIPQPFVNSPPGAAANEAAIHSIAETIIDVLDNSTLCLNPDLTLNDLAKATGYPAPQISRALNRVIGKNFYTIVNEYRTRLFIERINQPGYAHLSLMGLAYECGFGAKSTFYDFFKNYTGKSPAEFKKMKKKESG
ncbi:MAG: AraC family transcriptional regulator [Balneolaceae bacterium]|nr:MAG: AraC family transcriptional regulator [Balneolaceae bacterium]